MKHLTITEAGAQFDKLIAEVEATGHEVVITRDGAPIARLVREKIAPENDGFTPEQIERRREAIRNLRKNARELSVGATHEEIKAWINEGRH
uniref:Antitoxin n=1 Tax=Rhodopseudomonas palustris (strain BisA53) TaxID=316055 RepID=Q07QI5_RHOP5